MAREIQITPKRISFAQKIELKLYKTLMEIASAQQEKITQIIQRTLLDMKSNVAEVLEEYNQHGMTVLKHSQSPTKSNYLNVFQIIINRPQKWP